MADNDFTKFVPGFDFLQGLVKNAGAAIPGMNQWVAPTLNPQEIEKRIGELRTVQFWLEQNARLLAATIQALEVQRMTLSTLSAMNVPMADLKEVLKTPAWPTADAKPAASRPSAEAKTASSDADDKEPPPKAKPGAADGKATPAVDPMQWWGALTQQFTQLAANAMKDPGTDAARNLASDIVKHSIEAAGDSMRKAAAMPGQMAKAAQAVGAAAVKTVKPASAAPAPGPAARKPAARSARPAAKASSTTTASKPAAKRTARRAP